MKRYGSILDFTHDRNRDLLRAYRKAIAEAEVIVMPQIYKKVAESPASRFWVSERWAWIVISAMENGRKLPKMRKNKREMFEEIYRRYKLKRQSRPNDNIKHLIEEIVWEPAPRFYMTARTIADIIYRIRNGYYGKR